MVTTVHVYVASGMKLFLAYSISFAFYDKPRRLVLTRGETHNEPKGKCDAECPKIESGRSPSPGLT